MVFCTFITFNTRGTLIKKSRPLSRLCKMQKVVLYSQVSYYKISIIYFKRGNVKLACYINMEQIVGNILQNIHNRGRMLICNMYVYGIHISQAFFRSTQFKFDSTFCTAQAFRDMKYVEIYNSEMCKNMRLLLLVEEFTIHMIML